MHLIEPLSVGRSDWAGGYASVKNRGTSVNAVRYSDFEGNGPTNSGTVALDSYGSADVYVDAVVDVVVYDQDGVQMKAFTSGTSAGSIEVISQSFKGTDYVNGQYAASKPTTLIDVLDKVKTSFGTTDWNLVIDNSDRANLVTSTVQGFSGILSGAVVNVKDVRYGAKGDGVTDDSASIAACLAANVGRTVLFPAGTYNIGAEVEVPPGSRMVGCGGLGNMTNLAFTSPGNLSFPNSSGLYSSTSVEGMFIAGSALTSSYIIDCDADYDIEFKHCTINPSTGTLAVYSSGVGRLVLSGCNILCPAGFTQIYSSSGSVNIYDSTLQFMLPIANDTAKQFVYGANVIAHGSKFVITGSPGVSGGSSGTYTNCSFIASPGGVSVTGCYFKNQESDFGNRDVCVYDLSLSPGSFLDAGNVYTLTDGSTSDPTKVLRGASIVSVKKAIECVRSANVPPAVASASGSPNTISTVDPNAYARIYATNAVAAASFQLTNATAAPTVPGLLFELVLTNNTATDITTITVNGSAMSAPLPAYPLASVIYAKGNKTTVFRWLSQVGTSPSALVWMPHSTAQID